MEFREEECMVFRICVMCDRLFVICVFVFGA